MSDTYQATYDAVRSRISGGDIDGAVRDAFRDANLGHYIERAGYALDDACATIRNELTTPSAIYRPALSIDGNQWCALYGDNLQDGVAGFGDTPALAMDDFNRSWAAKLPVRATHQPTTQAEGK